MNLSDDQLAQLFKPINPSRVQQTQGYANLEAWDVIAHLTRVFGFLGWDKEVSYGLIFESQRDPSKAGGWDVAYHAKCRLTIHDGDEVGTVKEDANVGDALNQPSRADAHQLALTAAVSGAMKRAAKDLGNQFGLSLYKNGSTGSVVGSSLAHDGFQRRSEAAAAVSQPSLDIQSEPPSPDPVSEFLDTHGTQR